MNNKETPAYCTLKTKLKVRVLKPSGDEMTMEVPRGLTVYHAVSTLMRFIVDAADVQKIKDEAEVALAELEVKTP